MKTGGMITGVKDIVVGLASLGAVCIAGLLAVLMIGGTLRIAWELVKWLIS